jgi:Tol biopolymer transport system component
LLVLVGATASAGRTTTRSPGLRIVLGSDRDGDTRAYSVRPDGSGLSPVLPRGRSIAPVAISRDGSTILYFGDFALFVSRADGSRFHRVARDVYSEQVPALSPDGRLVVFTRLSAHGIWVVRADGRGLRRIALGGFQPDWAPDGRALALTESISIVVQPLHGRRRVVAVGTDLARPQWSPDGRWIAYVCETAKSPREGLWVVRANGEQRHRVSREAPSALAWSPDGRSLAYVGDGGSAVVGVGGGRLRALRLGLTASAAVWSPDGRRLVLAGHRGDDPDQIWIVRRDGHGLRRLTSAGRNTLLGWTALTPKLPQVRPLPPSERVLRATTVATRTPIAELSADGARVAFVLNASGTDCDHVVVWTPAKRSLVRLAARLPAPCEQLGTLRYGIYDLALAGTRVAWADIEGCGNSCDVGLSTATLARPLAVSVADAGGGGGAGGGDFYDFRLRGHGGLLVFDGVDSEPEVVQIGSGRQTILRHGTHSADVESVSRNRIAIREPDAVTVLDEHGKVVRVFPFGRGELTAVRLDGDRLVVTRGDVVEDYDLTTGAGEAQRPLPSGFALTDADGGIAVLQRGDQIRLLRLADGRSFTLTPGDGPVRADLERPGLYYSYATGGGGRLVLMPRAEVVRRLAG